jgi:hypothetical protein
MTAGAPERSGFGLGRFLLSGTGWPYLLVPFIPIAIVLELAHASAGIIFITPALGVILTAALMGRVPWLRPREAGLRRIAEAAPLPRDP